MNNTSDSAVFAQPAQKSNKSVFSDLYEENKSKVSANAAQPVSPAQLKIIYEKAYQKGYAKGEREAKENVMTVVHEELAELKLSMHHLVAGFKAAIDHHADRTSEEMLSLALEISKSMVKAEIVVNHEVVLPVIRQALTRLASVQVPIKLLVHPEDEALVARYMKESFDGVCRVIADSGVERGGCFLESETNLIDATNATRWSLICQGLGYSDRWLAGASNAD
ncbi:MAG: FliH/SctL family protein [Alcaligenaceae bacterium]